MLFTDLGQLLRREAVGEPDQRRPESAMNQGDLAIDEPADEDMLGFGDSFEDCEDLVTLRVCPPATLDGFTDDGLGETRCSSPG